MLCTYYNGSFYTPSEPLIPLTDRAVFFGDGIYDAVIAKNEKIFMLRAHTKRFFDNAHKLGIPVKFSENELCELLSEIAKRACSAPVSFIYFQLSRYGRRRAHAEFDDERSNLLITADALTLPSPRDTLRLIGYPDLRHGICNVKTLNLILSVAAAREARLRGADEAVFLRDGTVTECSHSNVHLIKNGRLITHPADEKILPGISRAHLIRVADEMGIEINERPFGEDELIGADEVIVTSTSKLALRAASYENHRYDLADNSVADKICQRMRLDFDIFTK
jgi:D-alanine transaminase